MKQLKSYIKESLLGDEDELVNNEPLLDVYNYIKDHYSTYPDNIGAYNIKKSKSGYIVDVVKGYLDIRFCKGLAVSRNMMYISKNINRVIS